jgi:hypothetical protein
LIRVDHVGRAELAAGLCLELSDYCSAPNGISNLRCLGPKGEELWQAELGDSQSGHYVAFETDGGRIFAWSFDGYEVQLDRGTGKILSSLFTK